MSTDLLTTFPKGVTCAACGGPIESGHVHALLQTEALVATGPDRENEIASGDVLISIDWKDQSLLHEECWVDLMGLYRREKLFQEFRPSDEYIKEAEHQDGYAYWLNFKDGDQLREDFSLYFFEGKHPG